MQSQIIYYSLQLKILKMEMKCDNISEKKYEEQSGIIKSKISSYIREIKLTTRSVENTYLSKTKEQLFDLFEMITSDLQDLKNHIENLKSMYNYLMYKSFKC